MNTIEFNHVCKKFKRGEKLNSLRDAIPNLFRRALLINNGGLKKDEFWALQDVSFSVKKGGVFGIIGDNGAGKSTCLKLLAGIMKPNEGKLKVTGRLSALIEVTAGFHSELTGRENTYLNGTIMGMTKKEIDCKFDQILEFSGIGEFIDTPIKRYSSGMCSRLGFSVAAFMNSDILLVDEVLSVGDIAFQAKCAQKMRELLKSGTTIVLVSHNLTLIQSICKRVILLHKGEVLTEGNPEDIIPYYQNIVYKNQGEELKNTITTSSYKVKIKQDALINILNVSLYDEKNENKQELLFGEPIFIAVEFESKEKIDNPIFSLDIIRPDGVLCCTSTSEGEGLVIDSIKGRGTVNISLGKINLAPGIYVIKVSIWDKEMIHPYATATKDTLKIGTKKVIDNNAIFLPDAKWYLI